MDPFTFTLISISILAVGLVATFFLLMNLLRHSDRAERYAGYKFKKEDERKEYLKGERKKMILKFALQMLAVLVVGCVAVLLLKYL